MSYILDALKRAEAERGRGGVPGLHAHQLATSASQGANRARSRIGLVLLATLVLGGIAATLWVWRAPELGVSAPAAPPVAARPSVPAPVVQAAETLPSSPPVPVSAGTPAAPAKLLPLPPAKASAAPAVASAPASVPLLAELSDDLRRQIPALTITGAVYSDNPAQRLLLVNGLVLPQGAQVASELSVEEIGVRSSVLSFRGTRFRLAH